MVISLQAVNPATGFKARYQTSTFHMSAAHETFRNFLRGRGWTDAQIAAAKIEEAPAGTPLLCPLNNPNRPGRSWPCRATAGSRPARVRAD